MYNNMHTHIQSLLERSIINLYDDQAIALGQTLIESEDVFAKDDWYRLLKWRHST